MAVGYEVKDKVAVGCCRLYVGEMPDQEEYRGCESSDSDWKAGTCVMMMMR